MNAKQLELLKNFEELLVMADRTGVMGLKRDGNMLRNDDNTIQIDIEQIETKARSTNGLFKVVASCAVDFVYNNCQDTIEFERMIWAADEEYDLVACWNGQFRSPYNYIIK